jgi:membrane-bound ClpP family serine protease
MDHTFQPRDVVRYRGRRFDVICGTSLSRPTHIVIGDDEGNVLMVHVSEVSQA